MKKILTVVLIVITMSLIMAGCSSKEKNKSDIVNSDTIKVGVIATLSGSGKFYGEYVLNGVNLAVMQINAKGGLNGKSIQLIVKDDKGNSTTAQEVATQLKNENVLAVIGPVFSSNSISVAPIFQDAKIPMITPTGTNYEVTQAGEYISRVCFTDNFQGKIMAKFAIENINAKTAVIMTDSKSDYSKILSMNFETEFINKSGTIKNKIYYAGTDTNFSQELLKIKSDNPEVVFLPGYIEVKNIIKQAREIGITAIFIGGDGWDDNSLVLDVGNSIDGSYYCTHFAINETNPKISNFVDDYKAKYGTVPSIISALGYDSMVMLNEAAKKAETISDREKIKNAINSIKDMKLVTGNLTMDSNRNPIKDGFIVKIDNQKFKYYTTVSFEE